MCACICTDSRSLYGSKHSRALETGSRRIRLPMHHNAKAAKPTASGIKTGVGTSARPRARADKPQLAPHDTDTASPFQLWTPLSCHCFKCCCIMLRCAMQTFTTLGFKL